MGRALLPIEAKINDPVSCRKIATATGGNGASLGGVGGAQSELGS
jgi:hypothetical protein